MAAKKLRRRGLRIAIGSDHAGFLVKQGVAKFLTHQGHRVTDMGTFSGEPVDYPDIALQVARSVAGGGADRGILACGTGIGMCIAANKIKGIRAAVVWSKPSARMAAKHNHANILCVPGRLATVSAAKTFVAAWLETSADLSARHKRRIQKILKLESKS